MIQKNEEPGAWGTSEICRHGFLLKGVSCSALKTSSGVSIMAEQYLGSVGLPIEMEVQMIGLAKEGRSSRRGHV